jgi:hypothetical protein
VPISRSVSAAPMSTKPEAVSGSMRPGSTVPARMCNTTMNTPPTRTAIAHSVAGSRGRNHSAVPASTKARPVLSCMMKLPASARLIVGLSMAQAANTKTPTRVVTMPQTRAAVRKPALNCGMTAMGIL